VRAINTEYKHFHAKRAARRIEKKAGGAPSNAGQVEEYDLVDEFDFEVAVLAHHYLKSRIFLHWRMFMIYSKSHTRNELK